jgi:hypothetical protein
MLISLVLINHLSRTTLLFVPLAQSLVEVQLLGQALSRPDSEGLVQWSRDETDDEVAFIAEVNENDGTKLTFTNPFSDILSGFLTIPFETPGYVSALQRS